MIGLPREAPAVPQMPGDAETKEGSNVARRADTQTAEQKAAEQKALAEKASKVTNAIDPKSKPPDRVMDGTENKGSNVGRYEDTKTAKKTGLGQPR